jgi:hypothetical protein
MNLAGFRRNQADSQCIDDVDFSVHCCTRRSAFFTTTSLVLLIAWTWKTFLARSRPIVVICIADGSFGSWLLDCFHNFGTLMPGAGAIHPICFGPKAVIVNALKSETPLTVAPNYRFKSLTLHGEFSANSAFSHKYTVGA